MPHEIALNAYETRNRSFQLSLMAQNRPETLESSIKRDLEIVSQTGQNHRNT
jgi:hypothetical protein